MKQEINKPLMVKTNLKAGPSMASTSTSTSTGGGGSGAPPGNNPPDTGP